MKSLLVIALSLSLSAAAHAENVSLSKAAELGLHRIERLVTLHKIDESFIQRFYGISAVKLSQGKPADAAIAVNGFQVPGSGGKSLAVSILMNSAGKALSYSVREGEAPVNAPNWPDLDPLALAEDSFHYLLDHAMSRPDLQPFYTAFTSMTLSPSQGSRGEAVARALFHSSASGKVLEIILGLDGSFISATIL